MDVTFLTEEQIWGDNRGHGQLQVMKDCGTRAGMSDLAIVLGGLMGSSSYKTSDGQRAGYVWSASSNVLGAVRTVDGVGGGFYFVPIRRLGGARPALPSSVTSKIPLSEAKRTLKILGGKEIQVAEYGEYPQTIVDDTKPEGKALKDELERLHQAKRLQATGNKYTFDGEKSNAYHKPFTPIEYDEYEHRDKENNIHKYIRVEAQPYNSNSKLSNGHLPNAGEACWIEVQPIEWLVDPTGVWVARQALFSGQFDSNPSYNSRDSDGKDVLFDAEDKDNEGKYLIGIKDYLVRCFSKEMLANQQRRAEEAKEADIQRTLTELLPRCRKEFNVANEIQAGVDNEVRWPVSLRIMPDYPTLGAALDSEIPGLIRAALQKQLEKPEDARLAGEAETLFYCDIIQKRWDEMRQEALTEKGRWDAKHKRERPMTDAEHKAARLGSTLPPADPAYLEALDKRPAPTLQDLTEDELRRALIRARQEADLLDPESGDPRRRKAVNAMAKEHSGGDADTRRREWVGKEEALRTELKSRGEKNENGRE